jgi:hypothetical protein
MSLWRLIRGLHGELQGELQGNVMQQTAKTQGGPGKLANIRASATVPWLFCMSL